MAMPVHARQRPEGLRFRLWSTVVDAYVCEPMERERFVAWMTERRVARGCDHYDASDTRLDRAVATGTSVMWEGTAAESMTEWDTEVCRKCGRFHHAYKGRDTYGHACSRCGQPGADKAHAEPCT